MYFLCTRDGAIIWHSPFRQDAHFMLNLYYYNWNAHIEYYDNDSHYCEVNV